MVCATLAKADSSLSVDLGYLRTSTGPTNLQSAPSSKMLCISKLIRKCLLNESMLTYQSYTDPRASQRKRKEKTVGSAKTSLSPDLGNLLSMVTGNAYAWHEDTCIRLVLGGGRSFVSSLSAFSPFPHHLS